MRARELAKRAVYGVGLGPAVRRLRAVTPRVRRRLAGWVAPTEAPLVRRERIDNGNLHLLLAFLLAPDSNCIDVGAHKGVMIEWMRAIAPEGHHIAYEPIPHLCAELRDRLPGVDVRSTALANERGEATFRYVRNMPGMSGLGERWYPQGEPDIELIEVHTERMDDDLPEGYVPDLIKIDVEGAEMAVLEGARETLQAHHPVVVFEYGRGTEDTPFGTSPRMIYDFFVALGYRLFDLEGHGPLGYGEFSTLPNWNWVAHR